MSAGSPCCVPARATHPAPPIVPPGSSRTAGKERTWCAVPGGRHAIGYEGPLAYPGDGEGPVREIVLEGFDLAATTVTNAEFAVFVEATGYRTDAEQAGGSFVFAPFLSAALAAQSPAAAEAPWWRLVDGACWSAPEGPGSDVAARAQHPVVHTSYRDAAAYARWSGTRLPDEFEWEVAARGGLRGALYPWGNELRPDGRWLCNIWQGEFPLRNSGDDGHIGTAPVRSYPANGYGLYEMCGNVWEWTAGSWSARDHACVRRGGSYLCHESWCNRYRVSARTRGLPGDSAGNLGFRVARDAGC